LYLSTVLSDGLDQFPPRKLLFTLKLVIMNRAEVCSIAKNFGNIIIYYLDYFQTHIFLFKILVSFLDEHLVDLFSVKYNWNRHWSKPCGNTASQ
jgi:hypothetical protein